MAGLRLARAWYAVIGLVALVMTTGHVSGAMSGSRFDPPIVAIGLGVGALTLAAAAWVGSPDRTKAMVAWLGIIAGLGPFAWGLTVAVTTAQDAIALAGIPSLVALGAAWAMAGTRLAASRA